MSKIDVTQPLELDDGTPVSFVRQEETPPYDILVTIAGGKGPTRDSPMGCGGVCWAYSTDGVWCGGSAEREFVLRNVKPKVAVGDLLVQLEARTSATFKVLSTDGPPHAPVTIQASGYKSFNIGLDLKSEQFAYAPKPLEVPIKSYLNIYDDGTIGKTEHRTQADARERFKVGKVRVGYLIRTKLADKVVDCFTCGTAATTRHSAFGQNKRAYAA